MIRISMEGGVIIGIFTDKPVIEQEEVYLIDYDVELTDGYTTTPYGDEAFVGKVGPVCKDDWSAEDLDRMCQETEESQE